MGKKVILLNGPSSSGKSTLARALQSLAGDNGEDYGIISIDDFLKMTINKVIYEDDVFEISAKLCKRAKEMLCERQGIIIDHVITSERVYRECVESLSPNDIFLVHVSCPLPELIKREEDRGNRCPGSAKASFEYLYPKEEYDLTVNTLESSAAECSLQIMEMIKGGGWVREKHVK